MTMTMTQQQRQQQPQPQNNKYSTTITIAATTKTKPSATTHIGEDSRDRCSNKNIVRYFSSDTTTTTNSEAATASAASVLLTTTATSTVLVDETPNSNNNNSNRAAVIILPHRSVPLGEPIPYDEHACSVSLPTWNSIVGYEEGLLEITSRLKCGYPRFVYHPYVLRLMISVLDEYSTKSSTSSSSSISSISSDSSSDSYTEDCLLLPSKVAALRCQAFLQLALQERKYNQVIDNALIVTTPPPPPTTTTTTTAVDPNSSTANTAGGAVDNNNINIDLSSSPSRIRVIEWTVHDSNDSERDSYNDDDDNNNNSSSTVYAVLFPAMTTAGMQAKAYWQHTGEIVSSRRAELALKARKILIGNEQRVTAHCIAHTSAFVVDHNTINNNNNNNEEEEKKNNENKENQSSTTINKVAPAAVTTRCSSSSSSPYEQLRANIAQWSGLGEGNMNHVFLAPSGMASIYMALRSARRYQLLALPTTTTSGNNNNNNNNSNNMGGTSIVYGFPYLDTLKLCSRPEFSPGGVEFFGKGCSKDLHNLEALLQKKQQQQSISSSRIKQYSALFTEVPSNPLLQCPDLVKLRQLADEYNFCLVIDDTISNFLNVDVLSTGIADAVCTSLTKLVSGRGDAMGGSIVCNPYTSKGRYMQQDLQKQQKTTVKNGGLHISDASAILCNSSDFIERNEQINANAIQLAEWLNSDDCPDVDKVYYPKINTSCIDHYHHVMRLENGYGGLMSILLHPHMCQRYFYDALDVAKGPSLGTNFTLVCPYTLLAHYHELDFAMGYNVPPNLLRIAVGLEPFEQLQNKFYKAFQHSRLYPKPKINRIVQPQEQTRSYSTSASMKARSAVPFCSRSRHCTSPRIKSTATAALRLLTSLVRP